MITWHGDGGSGHPAGVVEIYTDVSRIWVWLSDRRGLSFDNKVQFDPDKQDKKVYLHIKQKDSWPGNTSTVPAPAALPAGIALMGLFVARRKRRA